MLCRNAYCRSVLLFGLVTISSTAWTAEPAAVPADVQKETPVQQIERALDTIVDFDFGKDASLDDLLNLLAGHGIQARLDLKTLHDANVALDAVLPLRLKGVSLRDGLHWQLADLQLKAIIKNDMLVITTKDAADGFTEPRIYPVLDLLTNADIPAADITGHDFSRLTSLLENSVKPDTWSRSGGNGSIEPIAIAGAFTILQTQEVHAEIADVLAMLRRVRDQQFAGGRLKPIAHRSWEQAMTPGASVPKIRRALTERKKVDLQNVPMQQAAQMLARLWDIPLIVDGAGDSTNAPVTVQETDCTLATALSRMLKDLDADWTVTHGLLWISDRMWLDDKPTIRIYPVSDLVKRPRGEDELIDALQITVKPYSWGANGGPGDIRHFANAGALVVCQTDDAHEQIQTVLTQLRQTRDKQFSQTEAKADDPKNPPLYRQIYQVAPLKTPTQKGVGYFSVPDETPSEAKPQPPLAQFGGMGIPTTPQQTAPVAVCKPEAPAPPDPAADLAKVIPQIIEPKTWKEAGGPGIIQALPGRLVVVQTGLAHAQIARFVAELE